MIKNNPNCTYLQKKTFMMIKIGQEICISEINYLTCLEMGFSKSLKLPNTFEMCIIHYKT